MWQLDATSSLLEPVYTARGLWIYLNIHSYNIHINYNIYAYRFIFCIYIYISQFYLYMHKHVDGLGPPRKIKQYGAPKLPKIFAKKTWLNVSNSKVLSKIKFPVFVILLYFHHLAILVTSLKWMLPVSLVLQINSWFEVTWRPQMLGGESIASPQKKSIGFKERNLSHRVRRVLWY